MAEDNKFGRKNLDFKVGDHQTDSLANKKGHYLEFYHVPSGKAVRFKAFVTQFEDQYSSNWSAEPVYGRMDPISTFERTGRVIQATFEVPAASVDEGAENLSRLAGLIKMLYPSYDGVGNSATIKSSPLVKVMFMNWICQPSSGGLPSTAESDGLLGWLAGINYVPLMENGVLFEDLGAGENIFPKSFTVSFQLTVLHEEQVGWNGRRKRATMNDEFFGFPYGLAARYLEEGNYVKPPTPPPQSVTVGGLTEEDKEVIAQNNSTERASNFVKRKAGASSAKAVTQTTSPKKSVGEQVVDIRNKRALDSGGTLDINVPLTSDNANRGDAGDGRAAANNLFGGGVLGFMGKSD